MATLRSNLILSLKDRVTGPARGIAGVMGRLRRSSMGFGRAQAAIATPMLGSVRNLALLGAGYLGVTNAIGGTLGAAMSFEDAMGDIKKVVNFRSPHQFKAMRADILDLSKRIPVTAKGFAEITAAAGQANIPTKELGAFREMTAKVATAWDTTAAETGERLAKLKTGLGQTVSETRLLADAINHLSNNSAASAPNLLRFSRALPDAKQSGFLPKDALAFGAAMIGAGYQAEVADTSFRNMTKALTAGGTATKRQRDAFKALGFEAGQVAKDMQVDAVKTTLDIFEAIRKLPKSQQGAIARSLFGSEARALPALITNTKELRRTLGLVSDETKYAGSAQKEYEEAAQRTSNALKLLKNNIAAIGIGIGDNFLGPLGKAARTLSDTLLTLDDRVTVFDTWKARIKGFMTGLGFEGGSIGEQFGEFYDSIFGRVEDFTKDVDAMGRSFERFREMGDSVRSFGEALRGMIPEFAVSQLGSLATNLGLVADSGTLGSLAGLTLAGMGMAALGRGLLVFMPLKGMKWTAIAGGILAIVEAADTLVETGSLKEAISQLTGLQKAMAGFVLGWGAFKAVRWWMRPSAAAGATNGTKGAAKTAPTPPVGGGIKGWMKALGLTSVMAFWSQLVQGMGSTPGDTFDDQVRNQDKFKSFLQGIFGLGGGAEQPTRLPKITARPEDNERFRPDKGMDVLQGIEERLGLRKPMALEPGTSVITEPRGVQDVRITNPPQAPQIHMSVTVHATTNADPRRIADEVAERSARRIRDELAGLQSDREYGVA